MGIGLWLPYMLLALVKLEEDYAMWFLFFFVIPLLDVMFFVRIPDKSILEAGFCHKLPLWVWFPLVFHTACHVGCSYPSMISMGILYNTTLCLADELLQSGAWYDCAVGDLIGDYLGFIRMHNWVSVLRSSWFIYMMWFADRLWWHLGSILVGSLLYEYVCRVEIGDYPPDTVSHYGLANYSMFRFYHSDRQLLPTSHMWVFFLTSWES